MTRTQLQQMDDIALCEAAGRELEQADMGYSDNYSLCTFVEELVDRFRPHAQAPDAYPFPTHEEEPTL